MQHDTLRAAACNVGFHREMSLGTHGNNREIDRAQHLFCHGTEEQLAQLAPAPAAENDAIRLELADSGGDLVSRNSFAHQGVAVYTLPSRQLAPGLQSFFGKFQSAGRIVVRHADGIH